MEVLSRVWKGLFGVGMTLHPKLGRSVIRTLWTPHLLNPPVTCWPVDFSGIISPDSTTNTNRHWFTIQVRYLCPLKRVSLSHITLFPTPGFCHGLINCCSPKISSYLSYQSYHRSFTFSLLWYFKLFTLSGKKNKNKKLLFPSSNSPPDFHR